MKRHKFIKTGILLWLMLLGINAISQELPTYMCELRNDRQIDARTFEFDIYLLNTGTTEFQFTNMQCGIKLNPLALNGGTITVSAVVGSSELDPLQQPTKQKFSYTHSLNSINITAMQGPGFGMGTIISDNGIGTRFVTVRVSNSVDFAAVSPNLQWGWELDEVSVRSKVAAYVDNIPTEITVKESHTITNLQNLVLNPGSEPVIFTVTGGGSFCEGEQGPSVGIDGSSNGTTYTLYKNGIAASTITGTGYAINFGEQTSGIYTVKTSDGTLTMNGSVTITKLTPVQANIAIRADQEEVCSGTQVTFTAFQYNGGANPLLQWQLNGNNVGTNQATFVCTPDNNDVITCMIIPAESCSSGPVLSNAVSMTVTKPAPSSLSISASETSVCEGTAITVTAITVNGGLQPFYTWKVNGSIVGSNSDILIYEPTDGDIINCEMLPTGNCNTASVISNDIAINVNAIPAAPVISLFNNILFSTAPEGNQWYYTATDERVTMPVESAKNQFHEAKVKGWYYTVVTSEDGCTSLPSNKIFVMITGLNALETGNNMLVVYPNPTEGEFVLTLKTEKESKFDLQLYNQQGTKVLEQNNLSTSNHEYSKKIDLRPIAPGIYIIVVVGENFKAEKKIVVK